MKEGEAHRTNGGMEGRTDGQTDRQTDGQMDGQMDGWTAKRILRQMDKRRKGGLKH